MVDFIKDHAKTVLFVLGVTAITLGIYWIVKAFKK